MLILVMKHYIHHMICEILEKVLNKFRESGM